MDFKDFDSHYIMSDAGTFIGYMHDNFEETNDDGIWSYISDKFGIIHQQGKLGKINLTLSTKLHIKNHLILNLI